MKTTRRYPDRFAVIGLIPIQDPKAAALLPALEEAAGHAGRTPVVQYARLEQVAL